MIFFRHCGKPYSVRHRSRGPKMCLWYLWMGRLTWWLDICWQILVCLSYFSPSSSTIVIWNNLGECWQIVHWKPEPKVRQKVRKLIYSPRMETIRNWGKPSTLSTFSLSSFGSWAQRFSIDSDQVLEEALLRLRPGGIQIPAIGCFRIGFHPPKIWYNTSGKLAGQWHSYSLYIDLSYCSYF